MNNLNLLVLGTGIFAAGFLSGHLMAPKNEEPINSAILVQNIIPDPAAKPRVNAIPHDVVRQSEMPTQRDEIKPQVVSVAQHDPDEQMDAMSFDESDLVADEAVKAALDSSRRIEQFKSLASEAREHGQSPTAWVSQQFDQEPVEYEWAYQKQDLLLSAFEENAVLSSVSPQTVECKTRQCKVSIAVASQQQANQLSKTFTRELTASDSAHKFTSVSYFFNEKKGELVFYLADESGEVATNY